MVKARDKNAHWDVSTRGEPPCCEWPDCTGEGLYRAPRSRAELSSYRWFCLEHARAYNRAWNYYEGMSEDEVEADVRFDVTWNRPSWNLGAGEKARSGFARYEFHDPIGAYSERMGPDADTTEKRRNRHRADDSPEGKALITLELAPPVTPSDVKARYKALVKIHHPDANNGDKESEERFKEITQAYHLLMKALVQNTENTHSRTGTANDINR
ncbi:MAG: DnaJ domain-containing protein [Rhodospirillales bacterium]|nr:DnaJ domain-containing protein [Rhodospirillales bacterium]MCW8970721.1 DnaJ domain-containing protein [Rhodospirillales bacterium]MCW9002256.1 DnaJ domain-containing protein [Rhodospirillales bacterium]